MSGGRASRQKGLRAELKLRDEFRKLGYEARRIPLSGSQEGFKGDVVFEKGGVQLKAEVKSRKSAFKLLYAYLANPENSKGLILTHASGPLVIIAPTLETVLYPEGQPFMADKNDKLQARVRKKLINMQKWVQGCDILVVKDDRKPFLFIRYL